MKPNKTIPLTQGQVSIVDAEDYKWLMQWKWYALRQMPGTSYYACRHKQIDYVKFRIRMHRQILGAKKGQFVDHINHDGLDNRRNNIRICTKSQNNMNVKPRKGGTSKYRGVHWCSTGKKWKAAVDSNGHRYRLGSFKDEKDAARAYNKAVKILHCEFAYPNNI